MRGPQVAAFADKHGLKRISVADLIAYRQAREKLVTRVAEFTIETEIGEFTGYAYVTPFDKVHHYAFVYGKIGDGTRRADAAASRQRRRGRVRRRQDDPCRAVALQGGRPRRPRLSARRHLGGADHGDRRGQRDGRLHRLRARAQPRVARGRARGADPARPAHLVDPALCDARAQLCRSRRVRHRDRSRPRRSTKPRTTA